MKSEWITALAAAVTEKADAVPAGWKTAKQVMQEIGKSETRTRELLAAMISVGKVSVEEFRVVTPRGRVMAVPHYLLKK